MPPVAVGPDMFSSTAPHRVNSAQPITPKAVKGSKSRNVNLSTQPLKVAHQRVNIDVDLSKNTIDGLTEITVMPTSNVLKTIKLDCREMAISEILVNNRQVNFIYRDMLYVNDEKYFDECIANKKINIFDLYSNNMSVHQIHVLRQKFNYIFGEIDVLDPNRERILGNSEELTILLPDNLKLTLTDLSSVQTPGSQPNTVTPMHAKSRGTHSEYYTPLQIKIAYKVVNPKNGVQFMTDLDNRNMWHAYTNNSDYNIATSSWVPCIDNLWERSTWALEVNVPRTVKDIGRPIIIGTKEASESRRIEYKKRRRQEKLEEAKRKAQLKAENPDAPVSSEEHESDSDSFEEDDEEDDSQDLVVCTNDFAETKEIPHPTDLSKKTVLWSIFNPVCAHHVGWALGCFQAIDLPEAQEEELDEENDGLEDESKEVSCPVKIYCLPEYADMAKNTSIVTKRAIKFFSKEFGSFPFNSYSMAFVRGCNSYEVNTFAGMSLVDDKLLYPSNLIEPIFEVTDKLVESIASQWSGVNIVPQTFGDLWCTIAIARYMGFQFIKALMGVNEYRFRIHQYMEQVVKEDINKRALGSSQYRMPVNEKDLSFVRLKSPLLLYILDNRMTKTDKSFGLTRVLPKIFLQAMSGDLVNNTLSTQHFQYVCEKVNRNRLESFFKQWIYGSGVPIFHVSQRFNKKRGLIEVVLRQIQAQENKSPRPNVDTFIEDSVSLLDDDPPHTPQNVFVGPMTLRVHEADGTPYEHIVDLKDGVVKLDIHFNSKFRKRKNRDDDGGSYSRLGNVLKSEKDKEEFDLVDWKREIDDDITNDPFEWIRIDADFEWIAKVLVKQPDHMFASQLQYDRDVEAQYGAVKYFGEQEKPTPVYCTLLTRTIIDKRYFYGVRIAAARALAQFSKSENDFLGMKYLIKVIKKLFCFPDSTIPLANDFSDFRNFFLLKEIPEILSSIRNESGNVPYSIKDFLLNFLMYNENSSNLFQDSLYVAQLITSLTGAIINSNLTPGANFLLKSENFEEDRNKEFTEAVIEEIKRLQKLDEFVPSYQSVVLSTCVRQRVRLATYGVEEFSWEELLNLTTDTYTDDVKIEAFRGLLILGGLKNSHIIQYFLKTCLLNSQNAAFRSRLIDVLIESICISAVHGTTSTLDDPEFKTLEKLFDENSGFGQTNNTMVVIEEGAKNSGARKDQFARSSLKGTIQILRRDYGIGKSLRKVMWELVHSSLLTINERRNLFLVSQVIYEEIDSFRVDIPVPSVPLGELKRKIVLKNLGNGLILIHREGRFKIQLGTRKPPPMLSFSSSRSRAKLREETIESGNKLKLKMGLDRTASNSAPAEPVVPDIAVEPPRPTHRTSARSMRAMSSVTITNTTVSFKYDKTKLKLKEPEPVPEPIKEEEHSESIEEESAPVRRFVKISLRSKSVSVSAAPFEEAAEVSSTAEVDVKKDPEESDDIPEPAAQPVADSAPSQSVPVAEPEPIKTETPDPQQPRSKSPEKIPSGTESSREKSISRSASPFDALLDGPPRKKKKTDVYIHSSRSQSPAEELTTEPPSEPDQTTKEPPSEPKEPPKPKLKLKLNLKS